MPVITRAILFCLQYSIESLSKREPPGSIKAVTPASCPNFTQSLKGKKASLAITALCRSKSNCFAFSMACLKASIRLVCPHPLPRSSCLFLRERSHYFLDVCKRGWQRPGPPSLSRSLPFLLPLSIH